MASRWFRPEVYPLFAAVGVAVGICGFQLIRNICINPEVRINKEGRAAGVLENYAEGEKYAEHSLRRFVRTETLKSCQQLTVSLLIRANKAFHSGAAQHDGSQVGIRYTMVEDHYLILFNASVRWN
ncbi:unnamed protein product [Musa banksii]